jgi:hypothetical protein
MLNCTAISRAKKTAGLAVTYRAAPGDMYGTCPDTCPLKPVETKTREIDRDYESAVRHSVPKRGLAFLFTHFAPHLWAERNTGDRAQCTFNYSAPTLEAAANETALGNASVAVVPADYWSGRDSDKVTTAHGVRGVRCPDETSGIGCAGCGNGRPLCSRAEREYFIVFTAHGVSKRKAGDNSERGGCYAGGGNVALHWRGLSNREEPAESDAAAHRAFVKTLRPGIILRAHIAGDIGKVNAA